MSFDSPEDPSLVHEFLKTAGGSEELAKSEEKLKEFFEIVYQEYRYSIYIHIVRLVGDDETAQDLVQATFLSAWDALSELKRKESIKAWLYTIATNKAYDHLRHRTVTRNKIARWLQWAEKPEDPYLTEQLSDAGPE